MLEMEKKKMAFLGLEILVGLHLYSFLIYTLGRGNGTGKNGKNFLFFQRESLDLCNGYWWVIRLGLIPCGGCDGGGGGDGGG